MAITNNGTLNSLHRLQLPSGYTRPSITVFSDHEYISDLKLSILKSTVENGVNNVTMTSIMASITSTVDSVLAADYIATQTVEAYADLIGLVSNQADSSGESKWLNNSSVNYIATVKLYVKAQ